MWQQQACYLLSDTSAAMQNILSFVYLESSKFFLAADRVVQMKISRIDFRVPQAGSFKGFTV